LGSRTVWYSHTTSAWTGPPKERSRDEAARRLDYEGARGDSGHVPTGCMRRWGPWEAQWHLPSARARDSLSSL